MTTDPKPPLPVESELFQVSIRAWLVTLFAITLCAREVAIVAQFVVMGMPIAAAQEPFYSIVVFVTGFYFGQKKQ
jgi:hydrogenase/urease accessory protein HupE